MDEGSQVYLMTTCQHIYALRICPRPQSGRYCLAWDPHLNRKTCGPGDSDLFGSQRGRPWTLGSINTSLPQRGERPSVCPLWHLHPVTFGASDTFPVTWSELCTNCPWIWLWLTHQRSECENRPITQRMVPSRPVSCKQRMCLVRGTEWEPWQWADS